MRGRTYSKPLGLLIAAIIAGTGTMTIWVSAGLHDGDAMAVTPVDLGDPQVVEEAMAFDPYVPVVSESVVSEEVTIPGSGEQLASADGLDATLLESLLPVSAAVTSDEPVTSTDQGTSDATEEQSTASDVSQDQATATADSNAETSDVQTGTAKVSKLAKLGKMKFGLGVVGIGTAIAGVGGVTVGAVVGESATTVRSVSSP